MTLWRTLTGIVHGDAKVGKTWLGDTTPWPRLILDAEGGNRFTLSRKTYWSPRQGPPPQWDGTWETCVVPVLQWTDIELAYQWLMGGQHPFRSVTWDHVTEIQQKVKTEIAGMASLQTQDWGQVLTKMTTMMRQYRDLTMHPTNPLESVIFLSATSEKDGKYRPFVQGQLTIMMPYFTDIIGYMFVDAGQDGQPHHKLLVSPHLDPRYLVGDRTNRLPPIVELPNPNTVPAPHGIEYILDTIYGPRPEQGATQT